MGMKFVYFVWPGHFIEIGNVIISIADDRHVFCQQIDQTQV